MEKNLVMYSCPYCGNLLMTLDDSGVRPVCCGAEMQLLMPGTSDGASEKHVPVVHVAGDNVLVRVGSEMHPMIAAHYIEWIILQTYNGIHIKKLSPGEDPLASFCIPNENFVAAYAYCNLHGLWKL